MNLIEFCVRRAAFTIVLSLVITVLGIIGYTSLPLRWIPNINYPLVSINTSYPGANAALVETEITTPIETALAGIDGIESIHSHSKEGESNISLNFKFGHHLNAAVEDVRSSLQGIGSSLPEGAKQPIISKADTTNSSPVLYLAFSDKKRTDQEISNYVKQFILPRIQIMDGVAAVITYGEHLPAMHIWLDPMKMASSNITVGDVAQALREQNIQLPSGQIRSASRYYSVITNEKLDTVEEFNNLIIRRDAIQTIRLKNIGTAVVDAANSDNSFSVEGHPAIALGVIPQSNANPLDVAKLIKKEFKTIQNSLPEGLEGKVVFDQTSYVEASIHHVYQSIFEAICLVLVVIYLFLGSWRAAFIPIITIPICLIGTFAALNWLGYSLNTITLMALVLSIGLIVDDAIVMLENIMRYVEKGVKPFAAAIIGGKEIIFPIIAMTLTLVAVYAPIAMISGILGLIFKEFAVTLATSVIISGFVSLTLSPMMCARLLKKKREERQIKSWFSKKNAALSIYYGRVLVLILNYRFWVALSLIAIGLGGFILFKILPSELVPAEDMDQINVFIAAPRNASFQYTHKYVNQVEQMFKSIPEMTSYLSHQGSWSPSRAFQILSLTPREQRVKTSIQIAEELQEKVKALAGVDVYIYPEESPLASASGVSDGSTVAMEVMSSSDYKELHNIMEKMITAARHSKVFKHADSNLKWDGEQFEIKIDREKASDLHLPMQEITQTISALLASRTVGHFDYGSGQYDIILQMNKESLANPNIISALYVRNDANKMVSLADLVSLKETTSPEMFPHFDRMRSNTLHATLAPGFTIADGVKTLQAIAKNVLPDYAKYSFVGEAGHFLDSNDKMGTTFFLAFIFIYLILVALFESFIDPLCILLVVPFAVIGGMLLLKMAGGSLNIYSNIGLVTLIGLIAKHGILITAFANDKRSQNYSIQEAIIESAVTRLRPILMTTVAMILGALPLVLAQGPGSETRHQIGYSIVGGLLLGTIFSLIVLPVTYSYLAKFKKPSQSFREEDLNLKLSH